MKISSKIYYKRQHWTISRNILRLYTAGCSTGDWYQYGINQTALNKPVIKHGSELLMMQCNNCTLIKNIQLELATNAN